MTLPHLVTGAGRVWRTIPVTSLGNISFTARNSVCRNSPLEIQKVYRSTRSLKLYRSMLSYTVACSLFAVTINTELLTTDEYETIVSIYNEAKQRHAVRSQQSSGSEQKLVRPVAKYFLCSAVVMRFPRSFFRIASWTRSRTCKSVFQRWRRRGRPVPC